MNYRFSRKKHNRPKLRFGKAPMCPECFTAVALLLTGIVSTGGAAAVAAKLFHDNKPSGKVSEVRIPKAKEHSK